MSTFEKKFYLQKPYISFVISYKKKIIYKSIIFLLLIIEYKENFYISLFKITKS